MKRKNGFTLIELLAIIVILAIIAVITGPIILNIIENSQKGAAIDSAYGYKDAIQKYYVTKSVEDTTQELPSGYKAVSVLPSDFTVSGEKPSDGWIKLEKGQVVDYSLKIGDYVVTKYADSDVTAVKGVTINDIVVDEVRYYDAEWIKSHAVQYNPGHEAVGETEAIAPGKCTIGDDCKTWYPYSEFVQNGEIYVNMIMDRNTTAKVAWASYSHWTSVPSDTGVSYPEGITFTSDNYGSAGNKKGPLTVLNQLYADTDGWNLARRTDSYTPVSNSYSNYTIDYSGHKARLISAEEIAFITRMNTASSSSIWELSSSTFLYFGTLTNSFSSSDATQLSNQQKYSWLFDYTNDCTSYGCTTPDSSTSGYWTSSPSAGGSNLAWEVGHRGYLDNGFVSYPNNGVRPVITVLKSDIL